MTSTNTYKICLIGDAQTGKSAFLVRHIYGEFLARYHPTMGVEVHPLNFLTNYGKYTLNIWDCAGDERFAGLEDGYYIGAHAALIFFSLTDRASYEHLGEWRDAYQAVAPNTPVVQCGSKVDEHARAIKAVELSKDPKIRPYYDISAKSYYNFEKPFLHLLRELTGHADLVFEEEHVGALPTEADFAHLARVRSSNSPIVAQ